MSSNDIEETRRYYRLQRELESIRKIEEELTKIIEVDLPALQRAHEKANLDKLNRTPVILTKSLFSRFKSWLQSIL